MVPLSTDAKLRAACARLVGAPDWRQVDPGVLRRLQEDLRNLPEPQLRVIVMHYVSGVEPLARRAEAMGLTQEWYELLYVSGLKLLTEAREKRAQAHGGDRDAGHSPSPIH